MHYLFSFDADEEYKFEKKRASRSQLDARDDILGPTPEKLFYRFDNGAGAPSTPNLTTFPPSGTSTANYVGLVAQGTPDLAPLVGGSGGSLRGSLFASGSNFLNTGWATSFSGAWTIAFRSRNVNPGTVLP